MSKENIQVGLLMVSQVILIALESKIAFLSEKWKETYVRYGEVNLGGKKVILGQEPWQSFGLCPKAGQGGALV